MSDLCICFLSCPFFLSGTYIQVYSPLVRCHRLQSFPVTRSLLQVFISFHISVISQNHGFSLKCGNGLILIPVVLFRTVTQCQKMGKKRIKTITYWVKRHAKLKW